MDLYAESSTPAATLQEVKNVVEEESGRQDENRSCPRSRLKSSSA